MEIIGRAEILHVFDVTDEDREALKAQGYEIWENTAANNCAWQGIVGQLGYKASSQCKWLQKNVPIFEGCENWIREKMG